MTELKCISKNLMGPWGVDPSDFSIKHCTMIRSRVASSVSQSIHSFSSILIIFSNYRPSWDYLPSYTPQQHFESLLNFSLQSFFHFCSPVVYSQILYLVGILGNLTLLRIYLRNWGPKLMGLLGWFQVVVIGGFCFRPLWLDLAIKWCLLHINLHKNIF